MGLSGFFIMGENILWVDKIVFKQVNSVMGFCDMGKI